MKRKKQAPDNRLGLGQQRTLTFRDIIEALDDYVDPRHFETIKEIEKGAKGRRGPSFSETLELIKKLRKRP
jgi:hypothetical protein